MTLRASRAIFTLLIALALFSACVPVPPLATGAGQEVAAAPEAAATPTLAAPSPTATTATQAPPTATVIVPAATPTETPGATAAASGTPAPSLTAAPSRTPALKSAAAAPAKTATRTPTRAPVKPPTRSATATATIDRHRIVITENDIAQAIAAGAGAQQGLKVQNLKVRFADGKTRITADQLGYGLVQLRNLDLVGRLVVNNGALGLQVESMSPRGLAASMAPTIANQALAQYGSKWYVEDVKTLDGRVELRIR
jgi:hypothetical protein